MDKRAWQAIVHDAAKESDTTEQPTNKCAQLFSHVQLFVTPWTIVHPTLLSMGFPRQEYWNRLPFSTPKQQIKIH